MKPPIIILHGWGLKGSIYKELADLLRKKKYSVFFPNMPGFAAEPLKNTSMNLDSYVEFVRNFAKEKKVIKPIIIGHSFGGRIALKYAWKYPMEVSKIILTGAPIIRHITLRGKIGYMFAITIGRIFSVLPQNLKNKTRKALYFAIGEWDYYKSGPLKQVFENIINEDLTQYAKEVQVPVYLIWGVLDKLTPVSDVERIKKLNSDIKSVIVENYGHKLPYENPHLFVKVMETFL